MLGATLLATILTLLACIMANSFEKVQFYQIKTGDEITAGLLKMQALVFVTDDNSIIVPEYLLGDNSKTYKTTKKHKKWYLAGLATSLTYVQTRISSIQPNVTVFESVPIQGCVDNRFSDSMTSITKTFSRTILFESGPRMLMTIIGFETGALFHLGYINSRDEKLICNINPGQIFQLQAEVATSKVDIKEQRNITVTLNFLYGDSIEYSDWVPNNGGDPITIQSTSLSCVTNTTLLKC